MSHAPLVSALGLVGKRERERELSKKEKSSQLCECHFVYVYTAGILCARSVAPPTPSSSPSAAPSATPPSSSRTDLNRPSPANLKLSLHLWVDPLEDWRVLQHVRGHDEPDLASANEGLFQVRHAAVPSRGRDVLKLAIPVILGVLRGSRTLAAQVSRHRGESRRVSTDRTREGERSHSP